MDGGHQRRRDDWHGDEGRRSTGESIFQPEWSPDGVLYFVSDRTGWWNLYRQRGGHVEAMAPIRAEFGVPAWVLGAHTYAFESEDRIVCQYVENGILDRRHAGHPHD